MSNDYEQATAAPGEVRRMPERGPLDLADPRVAVVCTKCGHMMTTLHVVDVDVEVTAATDA